MHRTTQMRVDTVLRALQPRTRTLITPALVIDLDAVEHNIAAMAAYAGAGRWRPHIKTHKHPDIVRALLDGGITALKCATLDELDLALRTAGSTAVDVLVAYPLQPAGVAAAARLAAEFPQSRVRILLDSPEHARLADAALADAPARLTALLDVDVGMARTGTPAPEWVLPGLHNVDPIGLHGYEGHLTWDDAALAADGYEQLIELAKTLPFDVQRIVTSGTHAFHHALTHRGLSEGSWQHEVSPGTLVLSDLRSAPAAALLGLEQAAFVLSRVVSTPRPNRVTLDAGSKGLNPDCPPPGCAVVGHPGLIAEAASEEHRPFRATDSNVALGDLVALVPEHVCTTVNLYRVAQLVRGERDLGSSEVVAASRTHDTLRFGRT